jgi:hypothetical protein
MMLRKLMKNRQAFLGITMGAGLVCCLLGGGGLIVGLFVLWWIMNNLVNIGFGLLMIAIPLLLMVVAGVLIRRYLWKGGKK